MTREKLLAAIRESEFGPSIVDKAMYVAMLAHAGQKDEIGEMRFSTVRMVGELVSRVTEDDNIIAAAYLYRMLTDTNLTRDDLQTIFNGAVAQYVADVTLIESPEIAHLISWQAKLIKTAEKLYIMSRTGVRQ